MVPAMILCAGYGTRLHPLTEERPKPLVPIGDRPLLAHIVERLQGRASVVAINTHHLPSVFANVLEGLGLKAQVFHEESIRGTAGGIAGARGALAPGPCVVHNGDILADPPVDTLVREAELGGLCLAVSPRSRGEGTLGLDASGNVVRLRGEIFSEEASGGDYFGVAALGEDALAELPAQGCLIGDYALPVLRNRSRRVRAVSTAYPWSDVGSIAVYHRENIAWLGRVVGPGASWIGPGARVEPSVELEQCVIGAGARVEGAGRLLRCVVWPGATIRAPETDAIATTEGRLVRVAS
jgi:mannose-1-phosphate guanylyltransferase